MDSKTPQGPVTTYVVGSPFQPGDTVTVADAIDQEIHDVSKFIGRRGIIQSLNYDGGCEEFPGDPWMLVKFPGGATEMFWSEELSLFHTGRLRQLHDLIESCRGHVLTKAEFRAQLASLAYGDLAIEDPTTNRAAVEAACDELLARDPSILKQCPD